MARQQEPARGAAPAHTSPPQRDDPSPSGQEEHIKMLQRYREAWEEPSGFLPRTIRRVHRFLWWLMCFTGLDVLDYHERVLFSLGYLAVAALVLAGAAKQAHTLVEWYGEVARRRLAGGGGLVNGG